MNTCNNYEDMKEELEQPETINAEPYFNVTFNAHNLYPRMTIRIAASKLKWFLEYVNVSDITID